MFSGSRRLSALISALCVAAAVRAAPARERPEHAVSGRASPSVDWRFRAGSPIHTPPVVGADGTAYVGTSDGSFEAVSLDGVLRWSVTLEGAVAWAPVQDDSGRIYVATTAQRIQSFSPSGTRGWVVRSPVPIATDPVVSPWGLLFGGGDASIWAVSSRGAALWHAGIGDSPSASPGFRGRRIVVGTSGGEAIFLDGADKRFVARLGGRIRCAPVVFRDGGALVLADSSLFRLDTRGAVLWRRDGFAWLGPDADELYAVSEQGELVRFAGDGTPSRRVRLAALASGPPALGGDGSVFVPSDAGDIVIVGADGSVRAVRVARSPLHRPVFDASRRRLLVTAGDGTLAAVALSD